LVVSFADAQARHPEVADAGNWVYEYSLVLQTLIRKKERNLAHSGEETVVKVALLFAVLFPQTFPLDEMKPGMGNGSGVAR
jgi:hypothetical protein